ncbi:golgi vesicular membrane trafficking protein [Malassezia restricta]|uniref:t-SNARE coiled-coil homology domain-containing protein n=1 Tax=Malassezia restricta (strain ATCC 96810 / NBRC 103918 / CBS 7877) TaxID=425264 RepID=A0A3G2S646_MALR7|nr:golgi vesicular membrane trafficking protein [Malassezia restricta]AXA50929.1 golgi vesicular membrane trafficking protein [Malassezia restricta]AYO43611.1 hypothetical protein DNF11_2661 [Malassezia restricta CBS 7877]
MSSSYSNQHTHEQQNDDSLNRLFNKVHSLREITLHIHNDAEQQHSLLQDTSSAFDQVRLQVSSSARQFADKIAQYTGSHRITAAIVGGFVGLWALWFFFL